MPDDWFLIETSGDAPSVLVLGARSKRWRPASNEFRGSLHKTVRSLVETVLNNLKRSQVLFDVAGPRLAIASPVLGPSRHVHGILMWIGEPTETPPPEPVAAAWEWDLSDRISPQRVQSPLEPCLDLTLTDWLSHSIRIGDTIDIIRSIQNITVGERFTGQWIDAEGVVHRYAHRCLATFDGPRILGVSVRLPDPVSPDDNILLTHAIHQATAVAGGVIPAVVHRDTGRVVAWCSPARPDLPPDVLRGRTPAPSPSSTAALAGTPDYIYALFPTA